MAKKSKVAVVMKEFKKGSLKSGGSKKKVTKRPQAIAIALSKARKAGEKVSPKVKKDKSKAQENLKKLKKVTYHKVEDDDRDAAAWTMEEYKKGKLKVGKNGKKVKNKDEAVAIALERAARAKTKMKKEKKK